MSCFVSQQQKKQKKKLSCFFFLLLCLLFHIKQKKEKKKKSFTLQQQKKLKSSHAFVHTKQTPPQGQVQVSRHNNKTIEEKTNLPQGHIHSSHCKHKNKVSKVCEWVCFVLFYGSIVERYKRWWSKNNAFSNNNKFIGNSQGYHNCSHLNLHCVFGTHNDV